MAAKAKAGRETRAKVVAAEGEQKASFALREAYIIDSDLTALTLRYLQTLANTAAERESTILFPIQSTIKSDGEEADQGVTGTIILVVSLFVIAVNAIQFIHLPH